MGMFDAVSTATNAIGTPLSTASNLLAGNMGDGAANPGETGKPQWTRGYNLDVDQATEESAGQAPNLQNALNTDPVIEFIHFGWIHTSHSSFFTHESLSGMNKDAAGNKKLKPDNKPRGIQFRSALEREALLLWLFMLSTQQVLKQKEVDSQMGGLGGALDVASSMFGGNKPGGGQTQSSELTNYMQKVMSAITPVLQDSVVYKDIHQAGVDLHQARADYRALLAKIVKEKPEPGQGGGIAGRLMDQATALPSAIMGNAAAGGGSGGVAATLADVVSFTQGVVFKAQDVMAKLYAYSAQQLEPQIEDASNEMTYQAIHQTMNPLFQVWFEPAPPPKPPADQWQGPADPLKDKHGRVLDAVMGVMQGVDDGARAGVRDTGNSVKGIFEKPPENPPPGTEALGMAFNDPPKHKGDKSIVPMKMGDVAYQAFTNVLGLPSLGFADTAVSAVMGIVLEFTKALYEALLVRDPSDGITDDALVQSAASDLKLASQLEAIALEKLKFLDTIRNWDVSTLTKGNSMLDGFSMKPGAGVLDRGSDFLDHLIASKLSPLLDLIVAKAMEGVADKLEGVRNQGVTDRCHTMEWYLGRLPMVQATLFSDLFFPFWTQMMQVGADVIGGPTSSTLKTILAMAKKTKGVVDSARDAAAKAGKYADAASELLGNTQGIGTGGMDKNTAKAIQDLRQAGHAKGEANTPSKQADTPGQRDLTNHPLTSRVDTGQGMKIKLPDYMAMLKAAPPIFKWNDPDATHDPDASRDGANRTAPAGGAPGGS